MYSVKGAIVWLMLVFVTLHYKVLCLECPLSADAWERASQALQCKDPNYYHCLRDDNGRVVEHCLGKLWIQPGMCPEYNSRVTRIDVTECASPNCPQSVYWSNAVYLYPVCYGLKKETTSQVPRPTPQITTEPKVLVTSDYQTNVTLKELDLDSNSTESLRSPGGEGSSSIIAGVSIAGALVVLITALVLVFFFRKRKRCNRCKRDSNQANAHQQGNIANGQSSDSDVERETLLHSVDEQSKGPQGNPPHPDVKQSKGPQGNPPHPDVKQSKGPQGNPPHPDVKQKQASKQQTEQQQQPQQQTQQQQQSQQQTQQQQQSQQQSIVDESMKMPGSGLSENVRSSKDGCQVYVPEGPRTEGKFIDSTRILVLVLQTSSPEINKIIEESKKTFGWKYMHCRKLAIYCLKHKHEWEQENAQETTHPLKDFDFKTSGVEAILAKLFDVVSAVTSMAFVVTIPSNVWSLNREKITAIIDKDCDVFNTQHI
uniref:Uncharacterized protein LOC111121537 isoform X2 n=1 Tax=Crassostrea virginica TaxID=6565 RepID=A0A8B8CVT1_CRAVI|nr:uncharacterized protein LOC111121537 isoform X2 [Crassostrea virginica]